jgi:hypothetical protein
METLSSSMCSAPVPLHLVAPCAIANLHLVCVVQSHYGRRDPLLHQDLEGVPQLVPSRDPRVAPPHIGSSEKTQGGANVPGAGRHSPHAMLALGSLACGLVKCEQMGIRFSTVDGSRFCSSGNRCRPSDNDECSRLIRPCGEQQAVRGDILGRLKFGPLGHALCDAFNL